MKHTRPNISADIDRRHRWIRGDWQIAMWALPWVPNQQGEFERNPLSALSRWKILDNLRRSLVPAALMLFARLVLDGPCLASLPLGPLGPSDHAVAGCPAGCGRVHQAAGRSSVAVASSRRSAVIGSLFGADGLRTRLPTRRGLLQLGRGAADAGENDPYETQFAPMAHVQPMRHKARE